MEEGRRVSFLSNYISLVWTDNRWKLQLTYAWRDDPKKYGNLNANMDASTMRGFMIGALAHCYDHVAGEDAFLLGAEQIVQFFHQAKRLPEKKVKSAVYGFLQTRKISTAGGRLLLNQSCLA